MCGPMDHTILGGCRVEHRLPGRFRLRFDPAAADGGWALAVRLASHPDVRSVRWGCANRSLTAQHSPAVQMERILAESVTLVVPAPPVRPRPALGPLGRAALAVLLPGPAQLVLALASALREGTTVALRPRLLGQTSPTS
jgi:hypothetical protein